jgi:NifU-like protein involved in Fe-S cluster formation
MDEVIIKYYRGLLKNGFVHAGSLEKPDIFLDTVSENIPICGNMGDYLHLYIHVRTGKIAAIKYLCTCDPTANVAVEMLCGLIRGKTFAEIESINEDSFSQALASDNEDLRKKAAGLLELLHRGIIRYDAERA